MVYREFQRAPSPARLEKKKRHRTSKETCDHQQITVIAASVWGLERAAQSTSQAIRGEEPPDGLPAQRAAPHPKLLKPRSTDPEGRPACALICWVAALLDGWRPERSQWICWRSAGWTKKKKKRNGKTQPAWWFNGIPGRSPLQALPHSWVQRSLRVLWSSLQKI